MKNKEFEKWCAEKGVYFRYYHKGYKMVSAQTVCNCPADTKKPHYTIRPDPDSSHPIEICCEHLEEIEDYDKLISYALLRQWTTY